MPLYLKDKFDIETLELIAEFICGDNDKIYPKYRSSSFITSFFQNLGIEKIHDGSTRKWWILNLLKELNLDDLEKVILRLVDIKEYRADFNKLKLAIASLNNILAIESFKIVFDKNIPKIVTISKADINKILNVDITDTKKDDVVIFSNDKFIELDRRKYLEDIHEAHPHTYKCSKCRDGILELSKESINKKDTKSSLALYEMSGEVEDLDSLYSAFYICRKCEAIYIIGGKSRVEMITGSDFFGRSPEDPYVSFYNIKYFYPYVPIINLSANVPDHILKLINDSFYLFWVDCSSSGNKIRKALEVLMGSYGIEKGTLHSKIEKFGKIENNKYLDFSKMIMGVKWLGNFGSHKEGLSRSDLLDAYDVLNYVFFELFEKERQLENIKTKVKALEEKYKK